MIQRALARPSFNGPVGQLFRRVGEVAHRHPVLFVVVVAASIRLLTIVGYSLFHSGYVIPDEQQYVELAGTVADGRTAESWFPFYGQSLYHSTFAFTAQLARLYNLFGQSYVLAQLVALVYGTLTAALVVLIARRALAVRWALTSGLAVAFIPSQILFSTVAMRESMVWSMLALIALGMAMTASGVRREVIIGFACVVVGLVVLGSLRDQTMVAASWSVALAGAFGLGRRWLLRAAGSMAVALFIPYFVGNGWFGYTLVQQAIPALATTRANLAMDANSAIAPVTVIRPPTTLPRDVLPFPIGQTFGETDHPSGEVRPSPTSTTTTMAPTTTTTIVLTPDQRVVTGLNGQVVVVEETAGASLKQLPKGLLAVTLRPFPWEAAAGIESSGARVENAIWIGLYALGVLGLIVQLRRRPDVFLFPFIACGAVLGIAAITQGNVGTAFRHRGQVLWAVAIMAAAGAAAVAERLRRWRTPVEPTAAPTDERVHAAAPA